MSWLIGPSRPIVPITAVTASSSGSPAATSAPNATIRMMSVIGSERYSARWKSFSNAFESALSALAPPNCSMRTSGLARAAAYRCRRRCPVRRAVRRAPVRRWIAWASARGTVVASACRGLGRRRGGSRRSLALLAADLIAVRRSAVLRRAVRRWLVCRRWPGLALRARLRALRRALREDVFLRWRVRREFAVAGRDRVAKRRPPAGRLGSVDGFCERAFWLAVRSAALRLGRRG
jgi:hypothetical protein